MSSNNIETIGMLVSIYHYFTRNGRRKNQADAWNDIFECFGQRFRQDQKTVSKLFNGTVNYKGNVDVYNYLVSCKDSLRSQTLKEIAQKCLREVKQVGNTEEFMQIILYTAQLLVNENRTNTNPNFSFTNGDGALDTIAELLSKINPDKIDHELWGRLYANMVLFFMFQTKNKIPDINAKTMKDKVQNFLNQYKKEAGQSKAFSYNWKKLFATRSIFPQKPDIKLLPAVLEKGAEIPVTFEEWMTNNNNKKNTLIVSDGSLQLGGAGKTFLLLNFWDQKIASQKLTFYVPLLLVETSSISEWIKRSYDFDINDIKQDDVVFLIDGLNEIADETRRNNLLLDIVGIAAHAHGHVVMAMRDMPLNNAFDDWAKLHVQPLANKVVDEALGEKRNGIDVATRRMLRRPMMLSIAKQVLDARQDISVHGMDITSDGLKKIGQAKLMEAYMMIESRRAAVRLKMGVDDADAAIELLKQLAAASPYGPVRCTASNALKIAVESGLLMYNKTTRKYIFAHEDWHVFFQALALVDELNTIGETNLADSIENNLLPYNVCGFITELCTIDDLEGALDQLRGKVRPYCVANLIEALSRKRPLGKSAEWPEAVDLRGLDLSVSYLGTVLPGVNLSGATLSIESLWRKFDGFIDENSGFVINNIAVWNNYIIAGHLKVYRLDNLCPVKQISDIVTSIAVLPNDYDFHYNIKNDRDEAIITVWIREDFLSPYSQCYELRMNLQGQLRFVGNLKPTVEQIPTKYNITKDILTNKFSFNGLAIEIDKHQITANESSGKKWDFDLPNELYTYWTQERYVIEYFIVDANRDFFIKIDNDSSSTGYFMFDLEKHRLVSKNPNFDDHLWAEQISPNGSYYRDDLRIIRIRDNQEMIPDSINYECKFLPHPPLTSWIDDSHFLSIYVDTDDNCCFSIGTIGDNIIGYQLITKYARNRKVYLDVDKLPSNHYLKQELHRLIECNHLRGKVQIPDKIPVIVDRMLKFEDSLLYYLYFGQFGTDIHDVCDFAGADVRNIHFIEEDEWFTFVESGYAEIMALTGAILN